MLKLRVGTVKNLAKAAEFYHSAAVKFGHFASIMGLGNLHLKVIKYLQHTDCLSCVFFLGRVKALHDHLKMLCITLTLSIMWDHGLVGYDEVSTNTCKYVSHAMLCEQEKRIPITSCVYLYVYIFILTLLVPLGTTRYYHKRWRWVFPKESFVLFTCRRVR